MKLDSKRLGPQPAQEFARINAESSRKAHDINQTDVALAAFDGTYVGEVHPGSLRKLFLAQAQLVTVRTYSLSKNCRDVPPLADHVSESICR